MLALRSSPAQITNVQCGGLLLPARPHGPAAPKPRLLDILRQALRATHNSLRTGKACVKHFAFFHDERHPKGMGAEEVTTFLTSLATRGRVAASSQTQGLSAVLFLTKSVLDRDLDGLVKIVRAKTPQRLRPFRSAPKSPHARLQGTCLHNRREHLPWQERSHHPAPAVLAFLLGARRQQS